MGGYNWLNVLADEQNAPHKAQLTSTVVHARAVTEWLLVVSNSQGASMVAGHWVEKTLH